MTSVLELVKNKPSKLFTLIVVRDGDNTLLGYKKRGFGIGKWNAFGGKVEKDENIVNAAKRELQEESGLLAKSLKKLGVLFFENASWKDFSLYEVHLFITSEYEGQIIETDEMIPKWFHKEQLPFDEMWPTNAHWLPKALKEESFNALFVLEKEDTLIDVKIMDHY